MRLKDLGGWRVDLQSLEGWEDKSATGTPGQLQLSGELRQNSDATRLGVAYHVAGPDSSRTLHLSASCVMFFPPNQ